MRLHTTSDLIAGAVPIASPPWRHGRAARILLAFLTLLATAVAAFAALRAPATAMDPDLARVIRAMALIKGGFALAALIGCLWRLGRPARRWRGAIYVAGPPLMAAGAIGLFSLQGLGLAAIALHLGLFAVLAAALTDPDVFDGVSRRRNPSGAPSGVSRP